MVDLNYRQQVLKLFKDTKKEMTTDEVKITMPHIHEQTINSSVNCLYREGYLIDTGKRRATRSNGTRPAIVYRFQSSRKRKLANKNFDDEVEDWYIDPEHRYGAYLLRVDQAKAFARLPLPDKITDVVISLARSVVSEWSNLVNQLEERKNENKRQRQRKKDHVSI